MKWTETFVIGSTLAKAYKIADDLYNVGGIENSLYCFTVDEGHWRIPFFCGKDSVFFSTGQETGHTPDGMYPISFYSHMLPHGSKP